MSRYQRLVLRALGAILYCVVYQDSGLRRLQGHEARERLIAEIRDEVHRE